MAYRAIDETRIGGGVSACVYLGCTFVGEIYPNMIEGRKDEGAYVLFIVARDETALGKLMNTYGFYNSYDDAIRHIDENRKSFIAAYNRMIENYYKGR